MNILNKITKEYLKMNKKRTLVTIIGVILTGAMISGVATLATSFQNFLVETQRQDSGDWEARFNNVKYENVKYIEENDNYKNTFLTQSIYTGQDLLDSESDMKIEIKAYEKSAIDRLNIKLAEGNYATNSSEIVVPTRYMSQYSDLKVGDTIKLVINENSDTSEFKIVGTTDNYKLIKSGKYVVATHLDKNTLNSDSIVNISLTSKKVKEIYNQTEQTASVLNLYPTQEEKETGISYNNSLLMYEGVNGGDGFNAMLISVCGILILVIAIGSIIVIYNSFAISVSERKKQFGMLASIGATKKQIKKMVLLEGAMVSVIGIPLGILSGILGIWATLKVVDGLIGPMFASSDLDAHFELVISYVSLLIATVLIAITIYLSVFIPARKASKISPIEAIRGSGDIKIKPKKVRTPKFLRKIYGIEGDMALKNLKRSRKRYRTTVISLTISIVLFLTFNGFVTYMFEGFDALYTTVPYDYELSIVTEATNEEQIITDLSNAKCTNKIVSNKMIMGEIKLDDSNIDSRFKNLIPNNDQMKSMYEYENGNGTVHTYVISLDDNSYKEYLKQINQEELSDNSCILVNYVDGLYMYKAQFNIFNYVENDKLSVIVGNGTDAPNSKELNIAKVTQTSSYGVPTISGAAIVIVNNNTFKEIKTLYDTALGVEIPNDITVMIEADNTSTLEENIRNIMNNHNIEYYSGYSIKEEMQLMNNLKLIIQIFLYGFIVLISLIGISNIFNTITTNVNLRKREFANLKSIGMTDKAFNKMMNLECLLYGTKALLFGLPIGCVMCYLLSKAFSNEIMFMFKMPWSSIAIVIVAVYSIVFMTMMYAKNKIKKDNIIDVLRDDNI